ncbi:MAG: glutamine-synthetase adenylyltransferase, partial [Xanthomonadales bacterium]|nr:glutamine-synthetase adenylyltransferase [Xanthomonadales bacterium]
LDALDAVASLGLMPAEAVEQVRADYCALRDLENRLQAQHDRQTHRLPEGEDLERLARAMRQPDGVALQRWLDRLRERVRHHFEAAHPDERRAPANDAWAARWQQLREDAGDKHAGAAGDPFAAFVERLQRQALSQRAARRLDRFMPMLLEQLADHPLQDRVLNHVLDLVLAISRRSAYLSLLVHHPDALRAVLQLFEQSGWLASEVVRYPSLLDELIDPALVARPPDQDEIATTVGRTRELGQDLEARLNALNHVKRAFVLRIAVAELRGNLEAVEVPARLTRVAEAVLQAALELAAEDLAARHPGIGPGVLSVVGYGSLGAAELGYTSDLDVVFLHDAPDEQEAGITLLARRTLSLLTTPTPAGRLYEVDTRLRPNGRAGLLVSSLEAFDRYQRESAWTWELQALTRARPVAGDAGLGRRFEDIRRAVLAQPREVETLRSDLADMRARMRRESPGGSPLKHAPGGLVDIEFIAQLGVLANAAREPRVTRPSGTRGQLEALGDSGWLSAAQACQLLDVHAALLEARHRAFLAGQPPADVPGREGVINLFSDRVGEAPTTGSSGSE